ncbi:WxcM-like domain-containing protein [Sphingomonas aurantiaca]
MILSPGTVLLVLADAVYDEADYIRDHAEFLKIACA